MTNLPKAGGESVMRQLAPYLALGTQLTVSVLVCGAMGWYLDEYLGTTPWWLLAGLLVGVAVGGWQFIRIVRKLDGRNRT